MINFYIIATPIGNYNDITLRAIQTLKEVDFIVCEQEKEYKKLFSLTGIKEKKFILCNEHYEKEAIELVIPLLKKKEIGALISDCGTPLFEDPGYMLLNSIRKNRFNVTAIPGANSLVTALSLAPFKIKKFYYAGLLPREKYKRKKELENILKRKETIIILEAPYRLNNILNLLAKIAPKRKIFVPYNLTMKNEELFWGLPKNVNENIEEKKITKGEFLVVIEERIN